MLAKAAALPAFSAAIAARAAGVPDAALDADSRPFTTPSLTFWQFVILGSQLPEFPSKLVFFL